MHDSDNVITQWGRERKIDREKVLDTNSSSCIDAGREGMIERRKDTKGSSCIEAGSEGMIERIKDIN